MGLETGVNYIGDLNSANPTGTDPKGQGDDHLRNIKKAVKQSFAGFADAIVVTGTDTGSANAYVLTPTPALVSLDAGMLVAFTPANANTGASTLAISGLGAKDLLSVSGDDLQASELSVNYPVVARYDGTAFRLLGITKQYADQLAFSGSLPAISGATTYQAVFNDGAAGLWERALPQSTASNQGKVLKSTGVDGFPDTSSAYDWDAYQGVTAKSSGFTVALADRGVTFLCTNSITAALTAAATLGSKFYCRIINVGPGLVTIDPNGSETVTIPGFSAKTTIVLIPGEGVDLFCDGSNFIGVLVRNANGGPHLIAYEQTNPTYVDSSWVNRIISTLDTNLLGVSYSAGAITGLPPGTYSARFTAAAALSNNFVARVYNNTAASQLVLGVVSQAIAYNPSTGDVDQAFGEGVFTLSATSSISLQTQGSNTTAGGATYAVGGSSPFNNSAALWLTRISP